MSSSTHDQEIDDAPLGDDAAAAFAALAISLFRRQRAEQDREGITADEEAAA